MSTDVQSRSWIKIFFLNILSEIERDVISDWRSLSVE